MPGSRSCGWTVSTSAEPIARSDGLVLRRQTGLLRAHSPFLNRIAPILRYLCQDDPIAVKVALLHSLEGFLASQERLVYQASLFALDEINANGGVLGENVEPVLVDSACSAEITRRNLRAALDRHPDITQVFGGWMSGVRKAAQSQLDPRQHLLWYPVQYEGFEQHPRTIYTGLTVNQQVGPIIDWCRSRAWSRIYLIGSDYVFPAVFNVALRACAVQHGMEVVGEHYLALKDPDLGLLARDIEALQPDVIVNTINGDTNCDLLRLVLADDRRRQLPVISTSLFENLFRRAGCWNDAFYFCAGSFESALAGSAQTMVRRFRRRFGTQLHFSDPMLNAYGQLMFWKQACEVIGSTDANEIYPRLPGMAYQSAAGLWRMAENHHIERTVLIGQGSRQGDIRTSWSSVEPIRPDPWLDHAGRSEGEPVAHQLLTAMGNFANQLAEANARLRDTQASLQQRVDEQARVAARLKYLAYFDELTRLPNQNQFLDGLRARIAKDADASVGRLHVAWLNIDGFHRINFRLGEEAGNQVLQEFAALLARHVGRNGMVARPEQDDFLCCWTFERDAHRRSAALVDDLLAISRRRIEVEDEIARTTASIGITVLPASVEPGSRRAESLVREARIAMFQAKREGGDMVVWFDHQVQDVEQRSVAVRRLVAEQLARDGFELFFQPKVDMLGGQFCGAEVLLRGRPGEPLQMPSQLFPFIAGTRLQQQLDRWVICKTVAQLQRWSADGFLPRLSANVSVDTLTEPGFIEFVVAELREQQVAPAQLELEILESDEIRDADAVNAIIHDGRRHGLRFALDDFGTGYASLSMVRSLQVDTLKIDRSFVQNMIEDAVNDALVTSIVAVGRRLHRDVVAEGVESLAHQQHLEQIGCRYGQGFGIARPMPEAQLRPWAASFSRRPQA